MDAGDRLRTAWMTEWSGFLKTGRRWQTEEREAIRSQEGWWDSPLGSICVSTCHYDTTQRNPHHNGLVTGHEPADRFNCLA